MSAWSGSSFPSTNTEPSGSAPLSARRAALPSRRRNLAGPLHPPNRLPPPALQLSSSGLVPALSSPLRMSDSHEEPQPSVFLSPHSVTRKRSHFTASTLNPATPPSTAHHGVISAEHATSMPMDIPHLDSDASWLSGPQHKGSPTNRYGSWSRRQGLQHPAHLSEPQTSHPSRPPQGEFSFQAQAPSAYQTGNVTDHSSQLELQGETSSMAFARLAQAQRQQQEARRLAASGHDPTVSSDEHTDGPAAKKRRGVAGTIVDGALNAALYTGAAALTAYSLWSSWGRKANDDDGEQHTAAQIRTNGSPEKLPPGALEEPPPPYVEQAAAGPSKTPSSPAHQQRPVHVFVSSRRRRPVFATHRSMRGTPKQRTGLHDSSDFQQSSPALPDTTTMQLTSDTSAMTTDDAGGEEDDGDEMFRRFQSRMSNLIEEGTRALHAKADLGAMDLEDDDFLASRTTNLTPSHSEPQALSSFSRSRGSNASQHISRDSSFDPFLAPAPSSAAAFPRSQSSFTFGGDALRRPYEGSPAGIAQNANNAASSPRGPFLTLASRDPNSPYGRLSRPGSTVSSPSGAARRRH